MKTHEEREFIKDLTNVMSLLCRAQDIIDESEPTTGANIGIRLDVLQKEIGQALSDCERLLKEVL